MAAFPECGARTLLELGSPHLGSGVFAGHHLLNKERSIAPTMALAGLMGTSAFPSYRSTILKHERIPTIEGKCLLTEVFVLTLHICTTTCLLDLSFRL